MVSQQFFLFPNIFSWITHSLYNFDCKTYIWPYSSNHKISSSVSQQKWTNCQCLFSYFYFKHFSPQPTTTLTTYFPQKQKQKPLNQLGQPTRGGVQEPNQDPDHPSKGGTAETTCAAWPLFSFAVPRVVFSPDQNITSLSCLNSPLFSSKKKMLIQKELKEILNIFKALLIEWHFWYFLCFNFDGR